MQILIPEKILKQCHINAYELIAFCYLRALTPLTEIEEYYINVEVLTYIIYGNHQISVKIRENIYQAINSLIDKDIINATRIGKSIYKIQQKSLVTDVTTEKYTIVTLSDLQKIMKSDSHMKTNLFKYYIYLMSTINSSITVYLESGEHKSNIIGNQTQQYLAHLIGTSVHSVIRYNQVLEDLKVIYIYHSDDILINSNKELTKMTNIYGRYANQEYIDAYVRQNKKHKGSYNYIHTQNETANNDRRLSKMYYWLCKGKEYSENEIQEIYDYITDLNKKYENLAVKEQDDSYLANIKDESIFKQFKFLKEKGENL